jgi:ABC-type amino acid transport substrate-binding protein
VLCAGVWLGAQAAEPLAVCVAADNAPLSYTVKDAARGLDVRLAQAIADAAGRPLKLVPFETAYEKETQLTHEVNALLSSGVCEAVSGFPLLQADLGAPTRPSARTPDFPGAPRKRDRPFVPLGTLVPSQGYLALALGLVVRDTAAPHPPVHGLADLAARDDRGQLKLGVTSGTLAGSLAQTWRHGALRPRTLTVSQREEVLDTVADGRAGAALVALARFDGWKLSHRDSPLRVTAWRRPLDLNLGFVTLQGAAPLRALIDRVIQGALADGTLARWAAEEGVSWSPPTQPNVGAGPTLAWLSQD